VISGSNGKEQTFHQQSVIAGTGVRQ